MDYCALHNIWPHVNAEERLFFQVIVANFPMLYREEIGSCSEHSLNILAVGKGHTTMHEYIHLELFGVSIISLTTPTAQQGLSHTSPINQVLY